MEIVRNREQIFLIHDDFYNMGLSQSFGLLSRHQSGEVKGFVLEKGRMASSMIEPLIKGSSPGH